VDIFIGSKSLRSQDNNVTILTPKDKEYLKLMAYRDLTYIGRITVIETLSLQILVQILRVLPNPPVQDMKEIQDIFYIFLSPPYFYIYM
jgi:hypothetical protein